MAAAQIYNMLMDYRGSVTVKIDGIAASAASVIAMAGTRVLVSPVSMLMIHNPATMAMGDAAEMQKAIAMLDEVKESIINAYEIKTGMDRQSLSDLMDTETWMNAYRAKELGFCDEVLFDGDEPPEKVAFSFSSRAAEVQLMNRVKASLPEEQPVPSAPPAPPEPPTPTDPPTPPELPRVKVLDADTRLEHLRY